MCMSVMYLVDDCEKGKQVLPGPQDGDVSLVKRGVLFSTEHTVCFCSNITKMDGSRKWDFFLPCVKWI